jgi:polysaccharide biosynthesis protein PslH
MSRILFLSRWLPYPPDNGSKLRIYNLLRGIAQVHKLDLISFYDPAGEQPDTAALEQLCDRVICVPYKPFDPHSRRALLGFLSLTPRSVQDTFSAALAHQVQAALVDHAYDLVVASQIDMAVYQPLLGDVPALFEEAEVGVLYEQFAQATTLRDRLRYGLTWWKHRRYLARLLRGFRACTVVSEQEKRLLQTAVSAMAPVSVIPNGIDLDTYHGRTEMLVPGQMIFTGSLTYQPNYESMVWFLEEVYPQVLARCPEAGLLITGRHADRPLPERPNVTLTGFVPDIRPLVAQSWLSLAPIWQGGGTRLKILESMALHTPVVSTGKGAEGLAVTPDHHLLLADTADAFATAVVDLLQDQDRRQCLAQAAYDLVARQYDWAVIMPQFLDLLDSIQ